MDAELKAYLDGKFEAMESRFDSKLDALEVRMKEHTETVETRLLTEFWKWARTCDNESSPAGQQHQCHG